MASVVSQSPRTAADLQAFLHYGFVPRLPSDLESQSWVGARPQLATADLRTLLERAREALLVACGAETDREHIVPLSGGVDSRVLLAALLESLPANRVRTVTFGLPGTLDYELGNRVARRAGTRHESIDLGQIAFDEEALLAEIRGSQGWIDPFEALFNHLVPRRYDPRAVIWSGIMANTLNGSRVAPEIDSWERARVKFAAENRYSRSVALTAPGYDPLTALPAQSPFDHPILGPYEVMHLGLKYPSRFEPCLLLEGHEFRMPFRHPAWLEFAFALPPDERAKERFFQRFARHFAQDLFSLPTKTTYGRRLGAPSLLVELSRYRWRVPAILRSQWPRLPLSTPALLNYLDFEAELRDGPRKSLFRGQLDDLTDRGCVPWLDVPALFERHASGRELHTQALLLLTQLELNLKAAGG